MSSSGKKNKHGCGRHRTVLGPAFHDQLVESGVCIALLVGGAGASHSDSVRLEDVCIGICERRAN